MNYGIQLTSQEFFNDEFVDILECVKIFLFITPLPQ